MAVTGRERRSRGGRGVGERSEYDQRVLDVSRTARVVAGGRRFSFRATVVIGNRKGKVGLGVGKGSDVSSAISKAVYQAKKHLLNLSITAQHSIPHEVEGKCAAGRVLLRPVPEGHGLIAGGPVRAIAELGGIKNLSAKILGRTTNRLNNAKATMEALKELNPKHEIRNSKQSRNSNDQNSKAV